MIKKILHIIFFMFFTQATIAQVDTMGLSPGLDYYNLELKGNWDDHFAKGGSWETILSDKRYALDCKHVFLFEYFARLGLLDISMDIDEDYSVFAHGCNCGNEYLVRKGIKDQLPINKIYKDGMTALYFALQSTDSLNIQLILEQNPDLNIKNNLNENALNIASLYFNDTLLIRKLLSMGADYKINGS